MAKNYGKGLNSYSNISLMISPFNFHKSLNPATQCIRDNFDNFDKYICKGISFIVYHPSLTCLKDKGVPGEIQIPNEIAPDNILAITITPELFNKSAHSVNFLKPYYANSFTAKAISMYTLIMHQFNLVLPYYTHQLNEIKNTSGPCYSLPENIVNTLILEAFSKKLNRSPQSLTIGDILLHQIKDTQIPLLLISSLEENSEIKAYLQTEYYM